MDLKQSSALVGQQYKLSNGRGTLLGVITIPHRWAEHLEELRVFRFHAMTTPIQYWTVMPDEPPSVSVRVGAISLGYDHVFPEAVQLHDCPMEDFEALPGCSFTPSAAYLRSIIE